MISLPFSGAIMHARKWLALCAAGLLWGLLVCFLIYFLPSGPNPDVVMVLVAKEDIPHGTMIQEPEKLFVQKAYPRGLEPLDFVNELDQLRGKLLARSLDEGQPCTPQHLMLASALFRRLPKDYRAMTFRINRGEKTDKPPPGSLVDILYMEPDDYSPDQLVAKVLLEKALVLAVCTNDSAPAEPDSPHTITVAAPIELLGRLANIPETTVFEAIRHPE